MAAVVLRTPLLAVGRLVIASTGRYGGLTLDYNGTAPCSALRMWTKQQALSLQGKLNSR